MKNEYKQRTPLLGIPVVGDDDGIWPDVEMRKWRIVENMLVAGTKGMRNCLFAEGSIDVYGDRVVMQATGAEPSAEGIVNGMYFKANSSIEWSGMEQGYSYLLYILGGKDTLIDPAAVRTVASKNVMDGVLVGSVSLRNGVHINRRPVGKVMSGDLFRVPETIDFETQGEAGVMLVASKPVSFVQVCKLAGFGAKMGEISVGYHGRDPRAVSPENFVIYNDGAEGVPARVMIL